jgi:diguanylate cyclase
VVAFIALVAVLNLLLGYAAAVALVEPPLWSGLIDMWRRPKIEPAVEPAMPVTEPVLPMPMAEAPPIDLPMEPAPPAGVAGLVELPEDWLDQLAKEGIVAKTFVEASAHVLRLEVGRYREQLIVAEIHTRASAETRDVEAVKRIIADLQTINRDWLDKQTAAADMLTQRSDRLGDHEKAAETLEQVLLDQAALIRSASEALQSLDLALETTTGCKKVLEQAAILLSHAHALRDSMLNLIATLMKAGEALDGFAPAVQRDLLTGLPNRIGLEVLLASWWAGDLERTRPLSAVLIDIDRFSRINQRFGTRAGDRTIAAISRLLDEAAAKDRFEPIVRMSGGSFLLLAGDVGPHQSLTTAERLRQTLEATTFDDETAELDLTVSCGVIEVKAGESSLDVVNRATEAMKFAKKSGRNRCALDKGDGPTLLDPPQFPVKGRVVALRTSAPAAASPAATSPAAASA